MPSATTPDSAVAAGQLLRRLGLFDATMLVMGGIVGSGIFMNPYVVARQVSEPWQILGAWIFGGAIALAGGFIYAELAARRPLLQGQYAYLFEAYHPALAFLYGWSLLLVTQTGGMAAVAVTFARYFLEVTGLLAPDWLIAVLALGALTLINCLGVTAGSRAQALLMVLKIAAIAGIVACGLFLSGHAQPAVAAASAPFSFGAFGAAVTPVLFAYGGWQTSAVMAGELRNPKRDLARAMVLGVSGVVILYVAVNAVYLKALGPAGLAATTTPASTILGQVFGERGAKLTAAIIAISTLGFLSQAMLTSPRVYFSMAADGLFFPQVARVSAKARVPALAIVIQGVLAVIIALSGRYEQILNYVIPVDFFFIGLTATCAFRFRARDGKAGVDHAIPGHPYTTLFFVIASWTIVANTIHRYPRESGVGVLILLAGIPAYLYWRRRQ